MWPCRRRWLTGYIAAMLSPEQRRSLRDWLLQAFDAATLERDLVWMLPGGEMATNYLSPAQSTAPAAWTAELIQYWELQNLIAAPLFDQLRRLRPLREAEIDVLQQKLLGGPGPEPAHSLPVGPLGPRLAAAFRPLPPPPPPKNPFRYGPPADGGYFVGRDEKLSLIADKVVQGTPVALVGDPRIGKTSLLRALERYAAHPRLIEYFCSDLVHILPSFVSLDTESTAAGFWKRAFAPLERQEAPALQKQLLRAERTGYPTIELETLARKLEEEGLRILLLIDEWDHLTRAPALGNSAFLGAFRNLISNHNYAFSVVTTSRLSLEELGAYANPLCAGSPPFNTMNEERLEPFLEEEREQLLDRGGFSPVERRLLHRIAGHHPALLAAAAAELHPRRQPLPAARKGVDVATQSLSALWPRWSTQQKIAFLWAGFSGGAAPDPRPTPLATAVAGLVERGYLKPDVAGVSLANLSFEVWFRRKVVEADSGDFAGWLAALDLHDLRDPRVKDLVEAFYRHKLPHPDPGLYLDAQLQELR